MPEQHPKGPPEALRRASEPVMRAVSGRRWFPLFAVIHHRGRRSGTEYATPIAVIPTADKSVVLISMPYGRTNWVRNVVAAGGATLAWKGLEHRTTSPRIVEPIEAAALATPLFRVVMRRMPAALVLTRETV